jgi:hypothetical protein
MPSTKMSSLVNPDVELWWSLLRAKIAPYAGLLAEQGSLSSRLASGRRVWSLRFVEPLADGRSVQRSIYVGGNPELVSRVRQLLGRYRRESQDAKNMNALSRLAVAIGSATRACLGPARCPARQRRRPRQWSKSVLF